MVRILTHIIRLYQYISRRFFPKTCRFHPSCSQYSVEAIEKYGVMKGLVMAFGRIGRCSPFSCGGYDPVR